MNHIIEQLNDILGELLIEYRNSENLTEQYYLKCSIKYLNLTLVKLEICIK